MKKFFPTILLLTIPVYFINIFSFNGKKDFEKNSIPVSSAETRLIPSGKPVGIKVLCDGVLVIGFGPVCTNGYDSCCPAADSGIKEGDYISKINGVEVKNSEHMRQIVNLSMGQKMKFGIVRDEKELEYDITPVKAVNGEYALGMWIRDSIAGLGTLTYITEDGESYAALGHSVSDADTGELMEIKDGDLVTSTIISERKGKKDSPGELMGGFDLPQKTVGTVEKNCDSGLFGKVINRDIISGEALPIAHPKEVKCGKATMLSTTIGNIPQEYEIEIIETEPENDTKGMIVEITDKHLLEKTGGIVQGMSGSPVLQNGRIVGAVTHVFVNDPTRGYGIFIENMLAEAEKIK